ncbi:MAG: THUMP domain-containing protein [archaeon]
MGGIAMAGIQANLIVTYDPAHTATAKKELVAVLSILKKKPVFVKFKAEGVLAVKVVKPKETVKEIAKLCRKKPAMFRETFHYVPVDCWAKSEIKEMQKCVKGLVKGIGQKEKWKMELNKRSYEKHNSLELIRCLTDVIDRPNVDLDKPQKIVRVEIFGKIAAISLVSKDEIAEIPALK